MAAELNILSQSINLLDNGNPGVPAPAAVSSGQGGSSREWSVDDYVVAGAATPTQAAGIALQSVGSYYRLLRIPTHERYAAKISERRHETS
jgi:hypothetical protein